MLQEQGLLSGVRIIDFTQFLAGPYGAQLLGDLGAEIIKIEPPQGDMSRTVPPEFVGPDSTYFLGTNRSKRSIVIDMKTPEGLEVAKRLIAGADAVMENFRPGVMQRLGLDREQVRAEHPRLVWCSISGFGQTGPYRTRPAYDMIVQALSGAMSMTGTEDGPAVRSAIPIGDLAAGLHGALAVSAALYRQQATGEGESIDISMLDCLVSMLNYQGMYHLASGNVPGRQGRGHDSVPTYRAFEAGEGTELVITANTERMWQELCRVLGRPELVDDPRFLDSGLRLRNRDELWAEIEPAFLARTADEWCDELNDAGVPAATVQDVGAALADEHVRSRDMVMTLQHEDGTEASFLGDPIKLEAAKRSDYRFPPRLGEDTREVLTELGFESNEIDDLESKGAVVSSPER